jgi:cell fate regulator YaaT (PSP1 superfamily)
MANVVGVRFKQAGKIYYYDAGDFQLDTGNYVVARTERGLELGWVVIAPYQVIASELQESLEPLVRLAEDEDVERNEELKAKAEEALALARQRASELNLPMKLLSAQYTLDGSQLCLFASADSQVNNRDMARDLSEDLGVRVRFFDVGPRDAAKIAAARTPHYGICGRCLCCASWLTDFPNIAVKMAKVQNLPMDTFKLSGACGRLLCCLTYEYPLYEELRGTLPKVGQTVTTPAGKAKVNAVNILKQTVTLWFDEAKVVQEMTAQQLGYGTIVRPEEIQEEEEALVVTAAARSEARITPQDGNSVSPEPQPAEANGSESAGTAPTRRRRRRRRRGGNRQQ